MLTSGLRRPWGGARRRPRGIGSLPFCTRCRRSRTPRLQTACRCTGSPVEGTRAVTILVAFDAGARTERPDENGMAHFLEHLVFKGGEKYPTYRDVNEAAERIGAVLNAYTSHDLVAFHITARAQRGARGRRPADRLRRPAADRRRRSSTASAAWSCRRSRAPTISRR